MYPYEDRRTWMLRNRYQHAIAIANGSRVRGNARKVLDARAATMERWLKVRLGISILLVIGSITAAISLAVDALQAVEAGAAAQAAQDVERVTRIVGGIAGSLSGLLAIAWFVVNRVLGQLEVDVLGLLATCAPRPAK